ncbi:MAG TPA: nitric-oxide reductase large subunit, partial [Bacteroidota bacterium]
MREMIISKAWAQVALLVFAFGFFVLGFLAYRTYVAEPPIPERVTDPSGVTLFTRADVIGGQEAFLRNGLMEYGSIYGHGAYLGPDFTADYLRRAALIELDALGGEESDRARSLTAADFKQNRYDPSTGTLLYTEPQAKAYRDLLPYYHDLFSDPTTRLGLRARAVTDSSDLRRLTAYFSWTAWTAAALRPGCDYTYTNNWPYDPEAGNRPSTEAYVWSALSLVALLGGLGLVLLLFGKFHFLGWGGEGTEPGAPPPVPASLTPSQR